MDYEEFLIAKQTTVPPCGLTPDDSLWCKQAKDFQRDISSWAVRRGRGAIWADTGLGKSLMMLMYARQVVNQTRQPVIIFAPLAVGPQTCREANKFGIPDVQIAESDSDIVDAKIYVTNYQKLHRFNASRFSGVVLDEAQILRSHTGAYRNQLIAEFARTPYRLACTATPSPNDYEEIGNQAEFLGVCTRLEMLATYFHHDSANTSEWILKGHAERQFWEWVGQWAVVIRKPSDLGYVDEGYNLPPLRIHEHILTTESDAGSLVPIEAKTLNEQRKAKRDSLQNRVGKVAELVNATDEQWLIWCDLNDEGDALEKEVKDCVQVAGADDEDKKIERMMGFTDGKYRSLVSKAKICGYGMNWQHCHNVAFVGATDSFESFYQAIRRCWRYGQLHPVDVHVVFSDKEYLMWERNKQKQKRHDEMIENMLKYTAEINRAAMSGGVRTQDEYTTNHESGESWNLFLGDTCEVVKSIPDNSIDFSVFSPPFSSLYTYSNSIRDMGNCRSDAEFFEHYKFVVKEWMRIIKPGRLLAFHCMNLPTTKERDGYIGVRDFRGDLIRLMQDAGWIYHSEVCIWKDPVTAMQRTKAIGLLHKQIKKDSAISRQGLPDYLVVMRKPGVNDEPVSGRFEEFHGVDGPPEWKASHHSESEKESYSIEVWQRYASPVWMDINQTRVLNNYREGREDNDDRHIAPLQLDVIARAVDLWSNPGDTVFSPFAGIGSEGYQSILMGRKFVGIELKRSYFDIAVQNLKAAEKKSGEKSLFAELEEFIA